MCTWPVSSKALKLSGRASVALLGAAFIFLLVGAPSAFAGAVRYAEVSPGDGDPTVCALADPCSLKNAVEDPSVNNGDEVIVLPGTYNLGTGTVTVDNSIDLHGQSGMPPPKITTASTTSFTGAVTITGGAPTVHDLELENTGASGAAGLYALSFGAVVAERLIVTATQGATACEMFVGTLRDSICRNSGSGTAMTLPIGSTSSTRTLNLRNVTAVTNSLATAIFMSASGSGFNYVIDAKNTIALSGGGADVHADQSGGATATINFRTRTTTRSMRQARGP